MSHVLCYLEESPVDLFLARRYTFNATAREDRSWHVDGRRVFETRQDGERVEVVALANPPRDKAAGREHHRCVLSGGVPGSPDEINHYLARLKRPVFDRVVDALLGGRSAALYARCDLTNRGITPSPPDKYLGRDALVEKEEGLLAPAPPERVRDVLHACLRRMSSIVELFVAVGGPLVGDLASSGLDGARTAFGPALGRAPDALAFHDVLTRCELALLPTGGGDWGHHLGVYSVRSQRAFVEQALLSAGGDVYRVEDFASFDFHRSAPPWDELPVKRVLPSA